LQIKTGKIKKTFIFINSILLIIIILFTPLACHVCNRGYYENLYENNGVFSVLNKNDVMDATEKIFKFFKYELEPKTLDYSIKIRYSDESSNDNNSNISDNNTVAAAASFRPDEISHLSDVRKLLLKIFILYFVSIILFVVITFLLVEKNIKNFFRNLGIIFTISSSFMLLFIIALYFLGQNFPSLFENFHTLFFPQGNYAFSPGSLIITLFPYGFFYDFFARLIVCSSLLSIVLLASGIIGINLPKIKKNSN